MKFTPCRWRRDNLKGWSPQRIAAARRAVEKDKRRVQDAKDSVALFPELQANIQPAYTDEHDRMSDMDQREWRMTLEIRSRRAASWREARRIYFSLPITQRAGIKRLWSKGIYPTDPSYLLEMLRTYQRPGHSAWTHLRKARLCWLWARGIMPKPKHFLSITESFNTLGKCRTQRELHAYHRRQRQIAKGIQLHF